MAANGKSVKRKRGRPAGRVDRVSVHVDLDRSTMRRVRSDARREQRTLSAQIRYLVESALNGGSGHAG